MGLHELGGSLQFLHLALLFIVFPLHELSDFIPLSLLLNPHLVLLLGLLQISIVLLELSLSLLVINGLSLHFSVIVLHVILVSRRNSLELLTEFLFLLVVVLLDVRHVLG
jgi:hypothetical protein